MPRRQEKSHIWLEVRSPFHLEATVRVLQRRPTHRVDVWKNNHYLRALRMGGRPVLVEVTNQGTIDAPQLDCCVEERDASEATRVIRTMLGLDLDPAPFERALAREPSLHTIARGLRGMRPPRFPDFFEMFANVIPFQQVSLDAGMAVVTRLIERFGEPIEREGVRIFAFPSVDIIAGAHIDELRKCGLSARKAESLRAIACAIVSGELSEAHISQLPTSEALRVQVAQPGIGPWSASLVLLRGLGRLDAFPPGDVGVARGLGALITDDTTEHVIERFGEFRGYLYFCSLGASLLEKGIIS